MRRITIMDVIQVLQCLRNGDSDRAVSRETGVARRTVRKYRQWAKAHGLLSGPLPSVDELERLRRESFGRGRPPQNVSDAAPYGALILQLRAEGVEVAAICQRLAERGIELSYWSVYRYVRRHEGPKRKVTARVEVAPGTEAQVDFGYAGLMLDEATGKERRSWAFVMTLSFSRHQYVEFVWDQKVATWLRCHRNAFAFFGGVPQRIVLDNLKAGIRKSCWEAPEAQLAYLECATHYGFLIAPHRPRTPQHKGKVEQGGVHYLKRNFLAGRTQSTRRQANEDARRWCLETAGLRKHGTTQAQPWTRFQEKERAALQPLPPTPYDMAEWKQVKLHDDCHVVFNQAFYSAPFRLVGQQLYVRGGTREMHIFTAQYELVATHDRVEPGERQTNPNHLPAELLAGLYQTREMCREQAAVIGPATAVVVEALLANQVDRLPTVRRLLKLADRYDAARLEAACARALRFGDPAYGTVKQILAHGQESAPDPVVATAPPARRFVRSAGEILGQVLGGLSWN